MLSLSMPLRGVALLLGRVQAVWVFAHTHTHSHLDTRTLFLVDAQLHFNGKWQFYNGGKEWNNGLLEMEEGLSAPGIISLTGWEFS